MKRLEETAVDLPVFSGELYLELHRGTLTQLHDIKRTNRKLEIAIHDYELLSVMTGSGDEKLRSDALMTLLRNQFHDILPGTCIADANDVAVYENKKAIAELGAGMKEIFENAPELPTAVIAGGDTLAIGIIRFLQSAGIDIPRDMSIVSCDDMISDIIEIPLTAVHTDIHQQAQMLLEELDRLIAGGKDAEKKVTYYSFRIIRRNSTRKI